MANKTNNKKTNKTNIENNSSNYYAQDIQDFDHILSDTFSSVSIMKDGSESFVNANPEKSVDQKDGSINQLPEVTQKLMDGLKKQISVIFGKKVNVPFIFCLLDENGVLRGTHNGFYDYDGYQNELENSGEYFWDNEYVPGKLFLPTYTNSQWPASPVLIYWNSTEDKKEFVEDIFVKAKNNFNKEYQDQIQFIGVFGSKKAVEEYDLKWGGIKANNTGITDSFSNNDGVQKGFLNAVAFLLQQTFKTSPKSTPNDCFIFFIPSVFDANCRTGLLLLLLNPDKSLKFSTQKSKKTVQKGITPDELYQKLLVITRVWGLTTERQFLNHKNSRTYFKTIQEQADLFEGKITSQTLEQYLEQAFQSKPEFRNRICFIDLLCRNPDENNPNNPRVRRPKDGNRYNQDVWIQGDKILNFPTFKNGYNNDNSLDIIKTMPEINSPNDSFKYWESGIDYNNTNNNKAQTWSLYVNAIKKNKDNLKSYNNNEITHVVGIPFFDEDKKFIAGILVGFASKNNENRKEDDFNKNFIVWLHLIIKQLTSAYIINTKRGVEQERDKRAVDFAKAYKIGHSLKHHTGTIAIPLNSIKNSSTYPQLNEFTKKNVDRALSMVEDVVAIGTILDIISIVLEHRFGEKVFLEKRDWIISEAYNITDSIKKIVKEEMNDLACNDDPIIILDSSSLNSSVIMPWINQNGSRLKFRPSDLIYDELFRETLLNARRHGDCGSEFEIVVSVKQDTIDIDDTKKDVLIFSNTCNGINNDSHKIKLTNRWEQVSPSKKGINGIKLLGMFLEITNTGNVFLRNNNGKFEIAFYLKGMTNGEPKC